MSTHCRNCGAELDTAPENGDDEVPGPCGNCAEEVMEEALMVMLADGFRQKDLDIIEAALEHFENSELLVESIEDDLEIEKGDEDRLKEIRDTLDRIRKAVDVGYPPANRPDVQEIQEKLKKCPTCYRLNQWG